jgi:hypothetical protein
MHPRRGQRTTRDRAERRPAPRRAAIGLDAPIVRFEPGDPSRLVPGASIVVFRAAPGDDGTLSASRLTLGVDGPRLPM